MIKMIRKEERTLQGSVSFLLSTALRREVETGSLGPVWKNRTKYSVAHESSFRSRSTSVSLMMV